MRTKKEIAKMNDLFRTTMLRTNRHRIVLTEGVAHNPSRETIISAVRSFNKFTNANDPHKEHDFGKFEVNGEEYMFKIDYYDLKLEFGADPALDDVCRVLTIMKASEY